MISFGYWSLSPISVDLSCLPCRWTRSFCLQRSNLPTIGHGRVFYSISEFILYAPTDHRELPSNQAAELWRTGPGVEVQILPHHTGEGGWDTTRDMIFMRFSAINKATQVSVSALKDEKHPFPPPPPPLAAGPDKVPQVCELGSAPGGQAGSGAAGEVEADGCGGLSGAAVLPVHQPDGQTLRCGAPAAGRWWGRPRRICMWAQKFLVDPKSFVKEVAIRELFRNYSLNLNKMTLLLNIQTVNYFGTKTSAWSSPSPPLSRTCWCIFSSSSRRSSMKTSVTFREAWSQAARETARGFQMTRQWTGQ